MHVLSHASLSVEGEETGERERRITIVCRWHTVRTLISSFQFIDCLKTEIVEDNICHNERNMADIIFHNLWE